MSIKFNASGCVLCFDEANGAETIGAGTTGVDDAGTATAEVETTGIWLAGIVSPTFPSGSGSESDAGSDEDTTVFLFFAGITIQR